jgi:hypothetical protein
LFPKHWWNTFHAIPRREYIHNSRLLETTMHLPPTTEAMLAPYMLPQDIAAFKWVAQMKNLWLLVRRTNPESVKYMNRPGYSPKRIDCKPKTADFDTVVDGRAVRCAGLVVDPTIVGLNAFKDSKRAKAVAEWEKFVQSDRVADAAVTTPVNGQLRYTYLPDGRFYGVELDPLNQHYGCLFFTSSSLITARSYIHGDYDLYAIVDNAQRNVRTRYEGTMLGENHFRTRELLDVQNALHSKMGRPMVLHGPHETYAREHENDIVDVFTYSGKIYTVQNAGALEQLYRQLFKGRTIGTVKP